MANEKLLIVPEVAARLKYSVGHMQILMTRPDFPPPRFYSPYGRKFYSGSDVDFWARTRIDRHKRRTPDISDG